jgi:hypothetical protein
MPPLERVIELLNTLTESCEKFEACLDDEEKKKYSAKIEERRIYLKAQIDKLSNINLSTSKGIEDLVRIHSELFNLYYGNK